MSENRPKAMPSNYKFPQTCLEDYQQCHISANQIANILILNLEN